MNILITGASGFIGKNLVLHLSEIISCTVSTFERGDDEALLFGLVREADAIVHLAGENRPNDERDFVKTNVGLTTRLCEILRSEAEKFGRRLPLIFASSTQAELDNPYGRSKLIAEEVVQNLAKEIGNSVFIFRLPGVFGKWSKPNYNSVVSTYCYNIARKLPISITNPEKKLRLVYVDDVVKAIINSLNIKFEGLQRCNVEPEYEIKLGELATLIYTFERNRTSLMIERVGTGLTRALYSTYISFLPEEHFTNPIVQHYDSRGTFVEMLKTPDCGQFSYFTAKPGITRGGHYHHTKTEKFLVVKGVAKFCFRNLQTHKLVEISTCGEKPVVVDTIPGWVHDITNIGTEEMVVMLWANEVYNRDLPDTITHAI